MPIREGSIKRAFLSGMFALMPLTLTGWLTLWILKRIYGMFKFVLAFIPADYRELWVVQFSIVVGSAIAFFFLVVVIGYFVKTIVGKAVRKSTEHFLLTIPVVSSIYKLFKDFLGLVQKSSSKDEFKQVVFIEYPHKGKWAIGFLTGKCSEKYKPDSRDYFTVFMPTTPNPTTGFLMIVSKDEIKEADLTIEEAFKLILSGGFIKEGTTVEEDNE